MDKIAVTSEGPSTHDQVDPAVTEPNPSGRQDMERVAYLCRHFQTPPAVVINKHDLNLDEAARIEVFCSGWQR